MLTPDKVRLRYEITVEDPMYLTAPAMLTQQWEHRPDLELSQDTDTCDPGARANTNKRFSDSSDAIAIPRRRVRLLGAGASESGRDAGAFRARCTA